MILQFNKNIKCSNIFEDIFEPLNETEEAFEIRCNGDDKMKIIVNEGFAMEDFIGKDAERQLVFKENSQVRELGANTNLSIGIRAGFRVLFKKRGGKNLDNAREKDKLIVKGPRAFCYADTKCFRVRYRGNVMQTRKDKSLPKDVTVNVFVTKSDKVNDTLASNGDDTDVDNSIWSDVIQLETRQGRNRKSKSKRAGKMAKFCIEDEVRKTTLSTYIFSLT